jgi:hypothetical protein
MAVNSCINGRNRKILTHQNFRILSRDFWGECDTYENFLHFNKTLWHEFVVLEFKLQLAMPK